MKNNDDISTIDAAEINQLINRVKQGELDQVDAQLVEKLLNFLNAETRTALLCLSVLKRRGEQANR
jgi:hypothetical protein